MIEVIEKEKLIKKLVEEINKYYNEANGGIHTAEEALELISTMPSIMINEERKI